MDDTFENYESPGLIFKEESFKFIGICIEVHKILGRGFLEIIYKDAVEIELKKANLFYEREKQFDIIYKGEKLNHSFFADFVYDDKIMIEIKAQGEIVDAHYTQVINYLAVSKLRLGLIINFGEDILKVKRIVL
nr:GxxExxY protein [Bacteroidota bacterium]